MRKSVLSALLFFGTIVVLSVAYAAYQSITASEYTSGTPLTSSFMGKIVGNMDALNTRLTSAESTIASQASTISSMNTTIANQATTITTLSPAWAVMAFNLTTCPTGWSLADGGGGRPDLRGEFIRGLDNGRGVDSGRTLRTFQDQDWKWFWQTNIYHNSTSYSHNDVYMGKSTSGYVGNLFVGYWAAPAAVMATKWDTSEVRPRNVALLYCVKN